MSQRMFALMILWPSGAEPKREMRWLHRISYDMQQLVGERLQVNLLPERRRQPGQRAGGIIAAAVEAAINASLEATAQRLKERGDNKGRRDDSQRRFLPNASHCLDERLSANHTKEVDASEDGSQRTVDQCPIDEQIDVKELIAQDGDGE